MQSHVKIYMKAFEYGEQDVILCENCGKVAADIHHLIFKSQGGKNNIENVMALCRRCHLMAHANRKLNNGLKKVHHDYLKNSTIQRI